MALDSSTLAEKIVETIKRRRWRSAIRFWKALTDEIVTHFEGELEITDLAKAFDNFDKTKLDRDTFTVLTVASTTTIGVGSTSDAVVLVGNAGAGVQVNLPGSPFTGQYVVVKDSAGVATTWNITVNGNGNNIDASGSQIITADYGTVTVIYGNGKWNLI